MSHPSDLPIATTPHVRDLLRAAESCPQCDGAGCRDCAECPTCAGHGEMRDGYRCADCRGTGHVLAAVEVEP